MPPLRALPRLLVVLGLVLSTQSLLMLQMAFEVRQDYIAEHFCINRDRPELECDGKCYIRARMKGHTHDELAHAVNEPVALDGAGHDGTAHDGAAHDGAAHDGAAHGSAAHDHDALPPHTHPAPPTDRETTRLQMALSVTWLVPARASLDRPPAGASGYGVRPSDRLLPGAAAEVFHPPRVG